ncbi:MAG: sucrase ferredoxin [Acidimicrobiales bacterium]
MNDLPFDPALLPAEGASVRCATHAESVGLDVGGTALWIDELVVVDVGLPWPKPVWAKDGFTSVPELVAAAGDQGRRIRALAAVPLGDGVGRVVSHRLVGSASYARTEHHVDPADVADLLTVLLIEGLDADPASVVDTTSRPELLLCTQGSHDMCCGARGPALLSALELRAPQVRVRRVSHTGGHRMAPTGVTLPDGRMWGFLDVDEALGILHRSGSPAMAAPHCRGWIGVPEGPAQVAERAVFAAVDSWDFDTLPRTVEIDAGPTGGATIVHLRAGAGLWQVEVAPGRVVPTIACGAPGGLPAKPGYEWVVRAIEQRSD